MSKNSNLHAAKSAKNDEFYTQLSDIEKEVKHYKDYFRGKVVYCNCDDPLSSNFTKYFILNFHFLEIKKLICTFYDINNIKKAFAFVYEGQDLNGDGRITEDDIEIIRQLKAYQTPLVDDPGFVYKEKDECAKKGIYGSGDFRSQNCIEYLKMSDVVVTNPPFSLFREYVAQLMEYDKKFLIIGAQNAITFREIFLLIKENKLWLGHGFSGGNAYFGIPDNADVSGYADGVYNQETGLVKFRNCTWFTNIDHEKRHEPLDLYKKYTSDNYLRYDNYNAINVNKTIEIPMDYDGIMGVPISFLDRYCPEQFEIIGEMASNNPKYYQFGAPKIEGKKIYARILIRRKK